MDVATMFWRRGFDAVKVEQDSMDFEHVLVFVQGTSFRSRMPLECKGRRSAEDEKQVRILNAEEDERDFWDWDQNSQTRVEGERIKGLVNRQLEQIERLQGLIARVDLVLPKPQ